MARQARPRYRFCPLTAITEDDHEQEDPDETFRFWGFAIHVGGDCAVAGLLQTHGSSISGQGGSALCAGRAESAVGVAACGGGTNSASHVASLSTTTSVAISRGTGGGSTTTTPTGGNPTELLDETGRLLGDRIGHS